MHAYVDSSYSGAGKYEGLKLDVFWIWHAEVDYD